MATIRAVNDPKGLVRAALAKTSVDLESLLSRDYTIELRTPTEFRARNYLLPDGSVALGHVAGPNSLWLNSAYAARRPLKAMHVALHEVFHAIIGQRLTAAKKAALLPLMRRRDGTPLPRWGGSYQDRAGEILADRLAAHVAGIESPFDDYYGDLLDPAKALSILTAPDPAPMEPEPEPEPLPPPPDPRIAELENEVKRLSDEMKVIRDRAAQNVKEG